MYLKILLATMLLACLTPPATAQETEEKGQAEQEETALKKTEHAPPTPEAQVQYTLESQRLFQVHGETREPVQTDAPVLAFLIHNNQLYVAMGAHGAAVYTLSEAGPPVLLHRVTPRREQVTGFLVVDNQVWLRIVSTTAVPLDSASWQAPPSSAASPLPATEVPPHPDTQIIPGHQLPIPPKPKAARTDRGSDVTKPVTIISVRPGIVKLDAGSKDNVKVGDRFSVFKTISITDKVDGKGSFEGRELAAVIEVSAVNEHRSLAKIWRGDRVTMTNEVEPADREHTNSLMFPRRLDHLAIVSGVLRPILDLESGGIAALCAFSGTYIGSAWFAGVSIEPLSFGFTERGQLFATAAIAEGGYDGRWFGLGVGAGGLFYKANAKAGWLEDEPEDSARNQGWTANDGGFVLSQVIRLGPRDGLNLSVRNTLINMEWGGVSSKIDIPLTNRATLYFEGGGSAMGYGMGAIGVFTWLRGSGDDGSLGLSVSAGFAAVWVDGDDDDDDDNVVDPLPDEEWEDEYDEDGRKNLSALGPMVSLGLDYRFGL